MTISATCPKGHTLTLEEKLAGKKIRCPRCQSVFQVPDVDVEEAEEAEEAEAVSEKPIRKRRPSRDDDEDDDDRPRGKARRPDDDDEDDDDEEMDPEAKRKLEKKLRKKHLKLVDVGLLLHFIKLYMYAIGMLFGIALIVVLLIAGAQTTELQAEKKDAAAVAPGGGFTLLGFAIVAVLIFLLQLFISLIGPILGIVGSFLCCWVPKKSEARGTIITSLTFDLISAIAWLLGILTRADIFGMAADKTDRMIYLLSSINSVCTVVSWLTFLTFLRSLGAYIGEPGLGNEALNLIARLVVQVISLIVNLIANIAGVILVGGYVGIAIGAGFLVVWFFFFVFGFYIRMIKLLAAMRRAVQNKL